MKALQDNNDQLPANNSPCSSDTHLSASLHSPAPLLQSSIGAFSLCPTNPPSYTSSIPQYVIKKLETVEEVWHEWKVGIGVGYVVEVLEQKYGICWRADGAVS
ncbi:hypothetical protein HK096_001433, partial [Nowakowskiella sp. JEL0078]